MNQKVKLIEFGGNWYKPEDMTPTDRPYDDAQKYTEEGNPVLDLSISSQEYDAGSFSLDWMWDDPKDGHVKFNSDPPKDWFTQDPDIRDDGSKRKLSKSFDTPDTVKFVMSSKGRLAIGSPCPSKTLDIQSNENLGLGTPNPKAECHLTDIIDPEQMDEPLSVIREKWTTSMFEPLAGVQPIEQSNTLHSSKSKIIYVKTLDSYYYAEDLMPGGQPYSDAKPLQKEFAEGKIQQENKKDESENPGSKLLDLF